jgi:hypothetical protein
MKVFDNPDFVNGFIEFYDSADFKRYMEPFLNEMIEGHRDKLEGAVDPVAWQNRLKSIRYIKNIAGMLAFDKQQSAKDSSGHSDQE